MFNAHFSNMWRSLEVKYKWQVTLVAALQWRLMIINIFQENSTSVLKQTFRPFIFSRHLAKHIPCQLLPRQLLFIFSLNGSSWNSSDTTDILLISDKHGENLTQNIARRKLTHINVSVSKKPNLLWYNRPYFLYFHCIATGWTVFGLIYSLWTLPA